MTGHARQNERAPINKTAERMVRPNKRRRRKESHRAAPASIPGTLSIAPDAPCPVIHVTHYGANHSNEATLESVDGLSPFLKTDGVTWVNVDGLGDTAALQRLGELFSLHLLTLADIANVHQRPKVEIFKDYVCFVTLMRQVDYQSETEQVSIVLGPNWVLSVRERAGDCFNSVRDRIRTGQGRARDFGADYLAYLLIDAIVDHYFPIVDSLSEQIDQIEDDVLLRPDRDVVARVHDVRRDLLAIRRVIWPQRDAINLLLRDEPSQIRAETRIYFRDVYDHCVQLIDMIETSRELAQGLMDAYLSVMSNRMNEVMRVLTIIATIFIPLTFIAGIYGMNFDPEVSPWNMPELKWYLGYPLAMSMMAGIAVVMVAYFHRQGWLRRPTR